MDNMDRTDEDRAALKDAARTLRSVADDLEQRAAPLLGVTRNGQLTVDGEVDRCPQPFDDCRPGACNCDGIQDHWRMWHTDPAKPCPRRNSKTDRCELVDSYA